VTLRGPGLRPAVFLDRDGVLNEPTLIGNRPHPPADAEGLLLTVGAKEACQRLRNAGLLLVVVTNQPDVARGNQSAAGVDQINLALRRQIELDAIFVCPHDDADGCACRKPRPGMLLEAARQLGIDLAQSVMVGDRWRDVEAGRHAGCATVLVQRHYDETPPGPVDLVVGALAEAVPWILHHTTSHTGRRTVPLLTDFRVKIFADGADEDGIAELAANPLIKGFTTNPTLMRAAGVADYEAFARRVLARVPHRPISFEVFADDFREMARQARRIASWGDSVYVKIPVSDTRGVFAGELLRELAAEGIRVNVTALLTVEQVRCVTDCLADGVSSYVSVFAGRVADTGRDPIPLMCQSLAVMAPCSHLELIWASPREILNVVQADEIGCHIITVTHDLLKKLPLIGRDLSEFSLDTVRMFYRDAAAAGFAL
jgi:transaldolase